MAAQENDQRPEPPRPVDTAAAIPYPELAEMSNLAVLDEVCDRR